MKVLKRNAVIITVIAFVAVAGYLNWLYDAKQDAADSAQAGSLTRSDALLTQAEQQESSTAGLYYTVRQDGDNVDNKPDGAAESFSAARLARKQARDEAQASLQTVAGVEGASEETVNNALKMMAEMAEYSVKEAEIENIIRSKGFTDCVVFLSADRATVTVSAQEGLNAVSVARIKDVILSETDLTAAQLRVIEAK